MKKYFAFLAVLALVFQPVILLAEEKAVAPAAQKPAVQEEDEWEDEDLGLDEDWELDEDEDLEGETEGTAPAAPKKV